MIEITIYHEKDGQITTTDYNGKSITEENLDYVMVQFISNFGFDIVSIKKDGKELSDEEIQGITDKFSSKDNYQELDDYFHSNQAK